MFHTALNSTPFEKKFRRMSLFVCCLTMLSGSWVWRVTLAGFSPTKVNQISWLTSSNPQMILNVWSLLSSSDSSSSSFSLSWLVLLLRPLIILTALFWTFSRTSLPGQARGTKLVWQTPDAA